MLPLVTRSMTAESPWGEHFSHGQVAVGLTLAVLLSVLRPLSEAITRGNPLGLAYTLLGAGYLGLALVGSWRGARGRWGRMLGWCLVALLGCLVASELLGQVMTRATAQVLGVADATNLNNGRIEARVLSSPGQLALMVLFGVLLSPLMEEMVFRGVLFRTVARANTLLAHLVTAFAFVLFHIMVFVWAGHAEQWVFAWGYALFSLVLTAVYQRCRNLIPCIVAHVLLNALGIGFMLAQG